MRMNLLIGLIVLGVMAVCGMSCSIPGPSGGGSVHVPPEVAYYGVPTTLQMELTTWGEGNEDLTKRYTDIVCFYRCGNDRVYKTVAMRPVQSASKWLKVEATLPAFEKTEGTAIEYYFELKLDGHFNQHGTSQSPYSIPLKEGEGEEGRQGVSGALH